VGFKEGSWEAGGDYTLTDAGDFFDYGPEGKVFTAWPESISDLIKGDYLTVIINE